jgi:hypothetical protein
MENSIHFMNKQIGWKVFEFYPISTSSAILGEWHANITTGMRCIEGVDCCNANPGKETQIE